MTTLLYYIRTRSVMATNRTGLLHKKDLAVYKALIGSKIEFAHSRSCNFPKCVKEGIEAFENRTLKRCFGLIP